MTEKPSGLAETLLKVQNFLYVDTFGPKFWPMRYTINVFKGATFLWVLVLMSYFQNFSTGIYLYLFLHGTYGIAWLAKDLIFPDPRFMQVVTIGSSINCFALLTVYWTIPIPLAAGLGISEPSLGRIVFLVGLYLVGLVLMLGSDYQKSAALKKKKGLISDGFFKLTRNPNYLGEIMIYSSFVFCAGHMQGMIVVFGIACLMFAMNVYIKDVFSLQRKEGWSVYAQHSYILLPKLLPTFMLNCVFYGILLALVCSFLVSESPSTWATY